MGFLGLLAAAVGLSADAFTAAACKGIGMKKSPRRDALIIAAFFGSAQAIMPVFGYLAGTFLQVYVAGISRYVSFALLSAVGIKMIYDAFAEKSEIVISPALDYGELLALAVATSIDAATGIVLILMGLKFLLGLG